MPDRFKNLQATLAAKRFDGFIVTNYHNIFYLTGFRGVSPTEREALLVVTRNDSTLITARLYQQEASKLSSRDLKVKIAAERNEINKFIQESIRGSTPKSGAVSVEEHDIKYSEFKEFKKLLKGKKLIPATNLIEDLRVIKTEDEIKNIERAQLISQKAFELVLKTIRVGQTEAGIAEKLAKIIKSLGGQGLAFDSIVASGPNNALPHHVTGARRLATGDILLVDFGAKFQNYCADLSRTVFIGKVPDLKRNIYAHVEKAQKLAIGKIKTNTKASIAYQAAHNYFKDSKLDSHFLHSLGHGIGLEVHEKPSLSPKSKDEFAEGMVFSVEPGLYFPGWGGIRIEDLVVIQNGKTRLLGKGAQFIEIKA